MDIASILVNVISGAVGGNAAGAAMKDKSLGVAGNSIVGLLGGLGGGALMQQMGMFMGMAESAGFDVAQLAGQAVGGGVAGAIVVAIVGFIKQAAKK